MQHRTIRALALVTALAGGLAGASAARADLTAAKRTLQTGNWTVLREVDPMTDKADCTAVYKGAYAVQMSASALYIRVPGVLESVALRFGDEPARETRPVTRVERRAGSLVIEGEEFRAISTAARLRYRALTLSGVTDGDLDLSGISRVQEHIRAGCPE